jgi:hypothetical protein
MALPREDSLEKLHRAENAIREASYEIDRALDYVEDLDPSLATYELRESVLEILEKCRHELDPRKEAKATSPVGWLIFEIDELMRKVRNS